MRILIAEDDTTSRNMVALVLRKWGHEVVEAADGDTACRLLEAPGAPRLVILDWMMPGLSGPDLIRRLRRAPDERPPHVIMLTARGDKCDVVEALDTGANDYLTKPFDPNELRARVGVGQRLIELQDALVAKADELRYAVEHIKTLRGVVPICANCKKIRDDEGYWNQVETYVKDRTEAVFSHSVCPECVRVLYPEYGNSADADVTGR